MRRTRIAVYTAKCKVVARRRFDARQRRVRDRGVALGAQPSQPLALLVLDFRIDAQKIDRRLLGGRELVEPDDNSLPGFDFALIEIGGRLDFALHVTALDRGHGPAEVVDLAQVLQRLLFEFAREALDVIRAAERIDGIGDVGLIGDDLLGA